MNNTENKAIDSMGDRAIFATLRNNLESVELNGSDGLSSFRFDASSLVGGDLIAYLPNIVCGDIETAQVVATYLAYKEAKSLTNNNNNNN